MIDFGTGGFRGVIGESFNKENLQTIAQGIANIIKKNNSRFVLYKFIYFGVFTAFGYSCIKKHSNSVNLTELLFDKSSGLCHMTGKPLYLLFDFICHITTSF